MTLDEIRELEKNATKGPWECIVSDSYNAFPQVCYDFDGKVWKEDVLDVGNDDNGKFIAMSREAIPMLLEKIDKLKEAVQYAWCNCIPGYRCNKCKTLKEVFGED